MMLMRITWYISRTLVAITCQVNTAVRSEFSVIILDRQVSLFGEGWCETRYCLFDSDFDWLQPRMFESWGQYASRGSDCLLVER